MAMGRPDLATDERVRNQRHNGSHIATRSTDWLPTGRQHSTAAAIVELTDTAGVPCSIVHTVQDFCEHDQTIARESVVTVPTNDGGALSVAGVVPRLSETPGSTDRLGATLGERSVATLIERWADAAKPS